MLPPINLNLTRIILTSPGTPTEKWGLSDRFTGAGKVAWLRDYAKGDGVTDDTTAIQALITAVPDGTTIRAYPGEKYVVSSTLNMTQKTHIRIVGPDDGDCLYPGANGPDAPAFLWNGASNGTMFNIDRCFNPTISGFSFTSNFAINNFLVFDQTGSGVTSTAGYVEKCNFVNPSNNKSFVAINISPTSTTNVENHTVRRCGFQGSGGTTFAGTDGSGTGSSKTLTMLSGPFNSGQANKRIRISYQVPGSNTRGFIDDVIATFTDAQHVNLTTNNVPNQTGMTVHIDECYGVGILNGNSQNAKHHKFIENFSTNMCTVIACIGGSFEVNYLLGESDDFGIVVGYTMTNGEPNVSSSHITEPCVIRGFASEANRIGIFGTGNGVPIRIENARIENTKQDARGFFQLTDAAIETSGPVTVTPATNQIAIGRIGGFGAAGNIVSNGNIWGKTAAQVGVTTWNGYQFGASQWSAKDKFEDSVLVTIVGAALNQGLVSNPYGGMLQIFANSNTGTAGAVISGTGSFVVLAMYNFGNGTPGWVVVANIT